MMFRTLLLASALLGTTTGFAAAQSMSQGMPQSAGDTLMGPVLRANVSVTGDIVRIGDVIDNAGPAAAATTRLRFTGTAIETLEVAVLTRNVDRGDLLRSADLVVERRPKGEIGGDAASRDKAVGMQVRRPIRAAQALKVADLVKPDLVQRDQNITLIYQSAGLYLTTRGKSLDNGTEGDTVNVLNPQ